MHLHASRGCVSRDSTWQVAEMTTSPTIVVQGTGRQMAETEETEVGVASTFIQNHELIANAIANMVEDPRTTTIHETRTMILEIEDMDQVEIVTEIGNQTIRILTGTGRGTRSSTVMMVTRIATEIVIGIEKGTEIGTQAETVTEIVRGNVTGNVTGTVTGTVIGTKRMAGTRTGATIVLMYGMTGISTAGTATTGTTGAIDTIDTMIAMMTGTMIAAIVTDGQIGQTTEI